MSYVYFLSIAQPSSISNFLTSPHPHAAPLPDGLLTPPHHGTDSQQGGVGGDQGHGLVNGDVACAEEGGEVGEEEERKQHDHSMHLLEDCLRALVGALSQQDPRLVGQVEVLVQELRRITLLWEEVWIGTLTQLQSDVTRYTNKS